jgi:MFS family permease
MVAAGGPVIGVVVGGPVVEAFSWRWIFVAQVPLTALAVLVGWLVLPEVARRRGVSFDVAGSVLLAVTVSSLLVGLNRGPESGWASPVVLVCFALVPVALAGFVVVERRRADPLLPLGYVRMRNFTFPVINQFFLNFAYMGGFIITPLLLQDVLGFGEARTGFLSIARPLAFTLAGPAAGYLAVRTGERFNAVVGGAALVLSMLGLAVVANDSSELWIVFVLSLSGVAMGMAGPAMTAALGHAARAMTEGRAADATALIRAAEAMARVIGVDPADTPLRMPTREPLTPEEDAAREAAAKKGWNDMLDLIEAQADALARRILADAAHAPAVHSGFVHAWRAQYLGPEAAARDHADMQVNAPHRLAFHWHDDGRPLPVDEVRAMYYGVYRRQIRARAGLPAVGPGDGG